MNTKNDLRIFIMGAGCSAEYGYPLAKDFRECLDSYARQLERRLNCERLRQIVAATADLMERSHTPTIDRLVRWIEEEPGKLGSRPTHYDHPDNKPWRDKTAWAEQQVLNAKRVTMAMFLEREEAVRETALCGYRDFLGAIFDGCRELNSLTTTNRRVLSFNYDRLFEIAFASYFNLKGDCYVNCYGRELLNSGWDGAGGGGEGIAPDRFCFLKLHGSAAAWIKGTRGEPHYFSCGVLRETERCINDDFFSPPGEKPSPIPKENPEPFIVFPHEKDGVLQRGHTPICKDYLDAIWHKAEELVSAAGEIWVIGYSFDRNDRMSLMNLLRRKTQDCLIVVQNPHAEGICSELKLQYPDLAGSLRPLAKRF
jgi:hypothetical protein